MRIALTGILPVLLAGMSYGMDVNFPPPPRLATAAADLAKLKATSEFAGLSNAAVQRAEALLRDPVTVPTGPGEWTFYYANPENGQPLQAKSLTEHVDPTTGKVFTDERTVAAYRAILHMRVEDAAQQLGWAYAYTGDNRFAGEVKRILLKLAADYAGYPDRWDRWGHTGLFAPLGGRRYAQSLDEAVGVIKLAKAYDLSRTATVWTAEDRRRVEEEFFRPTADSLLRFNQDINNHQTWYNAGLICIASVLGDAALLDKVLTMRGGYYDQLQRSVGADGLWYEGTMAYHNYALQAMIEIADAGRHLGLKLHEEPRLRAMIEGPLQCAYPNGQFPAINDSDNVNVSLFASAFEWAARAYGGALSTNLETRSVTLEASGLAILRRGTGTNAVCVMMDYGPHGGGHGHFDKLNIMLYANGREWLLDPGRLDYSHPEYKTWVKHTAAHNTVTIDGQSQRATTGKLLWFKPADRFAACAAEATDAYPGAVLRRYLLLTEQLLVDVFEVETDAARPVQIDWFAHAVSDRLESPKTEGQPRSPGDRDGYQHLTDGVAFKPVPGQPWDFVAGADREKKVLRLWLAGSGDETVFTAKGIGYYVTQKVPCLIRRRAAQSTRFVTVYDLTGDGGYVQNVEPVANKPALTVQSTQGPIRIRFDRAGAEFDVQPK